MPRKWEPREDAIIRENFWSFNAEDLAAMLPNKDRSPHAVHHHAGKLGLIKDRAMAGAIRSRDCENGLERSLSQKVGEPLETWLRRRYIDEQASYRDIEVQLSIQPRALIRFMRKYGIEPISPSGAVRREMERDPNFLKAWQTAGHSEQAAYTRAMYRQDNWQAVCSKREIAFGKALTDAGMPAIQEYAVERWNIDFAYPDTKLAVELDPCWHDSDSKHAKDVIKDARLRELGWSVLRLETRTSTSYNVRKVSDALNSLAFTQPR